MLEIGKSFKFNFALLCLTFVKGLVMDLLFSLEIINQS